MSTRPSLPTGNEFTDTTGTSSTFTADDSGTVGGGTKRSLTASFMGGGGTAAASKRSRDDNNNHDPMDIEPVDFDPYLPTSIRPNVPDHESTSNPPNNSLGMMLLELHRIMYAMQQEEQETTTTTTTTTVPQNWSSYVMRVDMLRALWQKVSLPLQASDPQQFETLQRKVEAACDRAIERAALRKKEQSSEDASADATIRRVFMPSRNSTTTADPPPVHRNNKDPVMETTGTTPFTMDSPPRDEHDRLQKSSIVAPVLSQREAKPFMVSPDVQDIQKAQREQIEEAIQEMAAQMKAQTAKIHSTLKSQTEKLTDMEDIAADNVEQVTEIAQDVQDHVSRGWARTFGTWTLLFTLVGTFVFCLVTILMVPKRPGACLFFCENTANMFCRVLPSGRTECIDMHHDNQYDGGIPGRRMDQTEAGVPDATDECFVGMDGNCLTVPVPEQTEMSIDITEHAKREATIQKLSDRPSSPEDVFDAGHVANAADMSDIPLLNGKPFGASEFRKASASGDLELVSDMLALKPDIIDVADSNGWNALHLAARKGHLDVLEFLIENGADVHMLTNAGKSAEAIARLKLGDNHPVTRVLAELLSDDENKEETSDASDSRSAASKEPGSEPGSYRQPVSFTVRDFHSAAFSGDIEKLSDILRHEPMWVNEVDGNGWSALHQAARGGHEVVASILLQAGADRYMETAYGQSSVEIAYEMQGPEHPVTKLLLENDSAVLSDGRPFSPNNLREASRSGNTELVEVMLQAKPEWIDSMDHNGWTSLHEATRAGLVDVIEVLREYGCDLNVETRSGLTAHSLAIQFFGPDSPVVKVLSDSSMPVIDGKLFSREDLWETVIAGYLLHFSAMVKRRPDWLNLQDEQGWTALHLAAREGHVEIVEFIKQHKFYDPFLKTNDGWTAYDIGYKTLGVEHPVVQILSPTAA